jgi:hypothetical protein
MILYIIPNKIRKITTEIYTKYILFIIFPDLQKKDLILIQNIDLVYKNQVTITWATKYYLPLIILPGVSPDLFIIESIVRFLKRKFYSRRFISKPSIFA